MGSAISKQVGLGHRKINQLSEPERASQEAACFCGLCLSSCLEFLSLLPAMTITWKCKIKRTSYSSSCFWSIFYHRKKQAN